MLLQATWEPSTFFNDSQLLCCASCLLIEELVLEIFRRLFFPRNRHLVEVACGSNHSAMLEALESGA